MLGIIALAFIAFIVVSFALHFLFSPWLLLVAVAIVAWIKFGPRRAQR